MNNDKILEKVKIKIAISKFEEERSIVMDKKKNNIVKKISFTTIAIVSMAGIVFATNTIIKHFGANSSDGVQSAVDSGYIANANAEYKEANGITASVDSFLIDSYNFDIKINLKFDSNYNLNQMLENDGKIDILDLKVINENNQKVFATRELEAQEMSSLYKTEQEAKKNYDSFDGSYGESITKINDNEINYDLTAKIGSKEFPTSKKLNVSFNKIRYRFFENGDRKEIIYNGEWNYEIDVPSKMAESNTIDYKLVSISDSNYKFESAKVSSTAFRIYLSNCDGIAWNDNECVENENGQKFYPAHSSDGDGVISVEDDGIVRYYQTFNLTKNDATNNLKVHVFKENGEEVIIELTK